MTQFKTLVAYLDDSAQCKQRVEAAVRLAQRFDGHLAGVYLVPTAELTPSVAAMLTAGAVARRLAETGEAQQRAEALFRGTSASLAFDDIDFRAPAGDPMDAAIAHARNADLAIIGQPGEGSDTAGFARRLAEHVLLESGAPVLIVPRGETSAESGKNVLLAWDAGREAARTTRDALAILARAAQVTVVSVTHDSAHADALAQSQARLAAYLSAHAINAHFRHVDGHDRETGERLLSEVDSIGADLIVMGGYGHSRSRELVLGGTTRTMLRAMSVPVFMSH